MRIITREKVMKHLYTVDIYRQINKSDDIAAFFTTEQGAEIALQQQGYLLNEKDDLPYFHETFNGTMKQIQAIDEKIQTYTKSGWNLAQFGFVERAIIRLAVFELFFSEDESLNEKIVIASMLELSDKFIEEKSVKFIHGILGAMINEQVPPKEKKKEVKDDALDKATKKQNLAALKKFNEKKRKDKWAAEKLEQAKLEKELAENPDMKRPGYRSPNSPTRK